jgi:endonuclease YncB( thermonuclease family)
MMRPMPLIAACLLLAACEAPPAEKAEERSNAAVAPAAVASGAAFTCTPTRVWDGDGPIWCAEGPRLRLAGVAAREMDGSCREGHPCPAASAEEAKAALVAQLGGSTGTHRDGHALVSGPPMLCTSNGGAGRGRTGAWCTLPDGRDLSCAMVATGTVLRWEDFDRQRRLIRCG